VHPLKPQVNPTIRPARAAKGRPTSAVRPGQTGPGRRQLVNVIPVDVLLTVGADAAMLPPQMLGEEQMDPGAVNRSEPALSSSA
jgi:hypothetical protein